MLRFVFSIVSYCVVLCRIIHTLLPSLPPSLPVQFGTAFVFCSRTPYSVLGRLLSPSHGLARLSYSIFVFRILYWVDPSLPVQFGTGFVFCIRIPYSVLGRPLSLSRTNSPRQYGLARVSYRVFVSRILYRGSIQYSLARALLSSQYRIRNTNTEYESRAKTYWHDLATRSLPDTLYDLALLSYSVFVFRILYWGRKL